MHNLFSHLFNDFDFDNEINLVYFMKFFVDWDEPPSESSRRKETIIAIETVHHGCICQDWQQ